MLEVAEKLLIVPFVTVISPAIKFVVGSLDVKVKDKLALLVVEPLVTPAAVIFIVGGVVSEPAIVKFQVPLVLVSFKVQFKAPEVPVTIPSLSVSPTPAFSIPTITLL